MREAQDAGVIVSLNDCENIGGAVLISEHGTGALAEEIGHVGIGGEKAVFLGEQPCGAGAGVGFANDKYGRRKFTNDAREFGNGIGGWLVPNWQRFGFGGEVK